MLLRSTVGLVAITEKRINIKKKIQFVTNSGEISPESFGLLDEVAGIIRSNPQIARIEIQGHTDDKGARRLNV